MNGKGLEKVGKTLADSNGIYTPWFKAQNKALSFIILLLSSGYLIVLSSVLCPRKVINSQRHAITVWDFHFPEMSCRHSAYREPKVSSQNSG